MKIPTKFYYTISYPDKEELYEETYHIEDKKVSIYTIREGALVLLKEDTIPMYEVSVEVAAQYVQDVCNIDISILDLTLL